jgi:hypothetical protein
MSEGEGAVVELREDKKSERRAGASLWLSDSDPLRYVVRETDWALEAGGVQLPVVDGRRAEGDFLQMSGDRFMPAQEGLLGAVLGELAGSRPLGVRRAERFLPTGAALTAVGELVAAVDAPAAFRGAPRAKGRMAVLQAPAGGRGPFILSRQSLAELVAAATAAADKYRAAALWFGGAGASMLLAAASFRGWVWLRERRALARARGARARRASRGGAAAAAATARDANDDGGGGGDGRRGLCVVCLERDADFVFPCGHLCECAACGARAPAPAKCPICRRAGQPVRVFMT